MQYRDYVKSEKLFESAGEHFNKIGHSLSDMKCLVIENVISKDPFVRKEHERQYIQKFQTEAFA